MLPPLVTQSLPTGAWSRRSISGSAALTGITAGKNKPRAINIGTIRGCIGLPPFFAGAEPAHSLAQIADRCPFLTRRTVVPGGVKLCVRPAVFFGYSTITCPYIHGCGVQM